MKLTDIVIFSVRNVYRGGIRTLLCVTAVLTGVLSLYVADRGGEYAKSMVKNEMGKLGIQGVIIYSKNGADIGNSGIRALRETEGIEYASLLRMETGKLRLKKYSSSALLIGADWNIENVWSFSLIHGEMFKKSDIEKKRRVAVIDSELAYKVYKRENVVGKTVYISVNGVYEPHEIIGVVFSQKESIQNMTGVKVPEIVYVPYNNFNGNELAAIACTASTDTVAEDALSRLKSLNGFSYEYKNLDSYMNSLENIAETIAVLASVFAAIALLVGGMGIMSNMINAAEKRKYEIGVITALGAAKKDIAFMFIFESVFICIIGAAGGWLIGECAADYVSFRLGIELGNGVNAAMRGFSLSVLCGTIFGLIPSLKAAFLKPAKAMKR